MKSCLTRVAYQRSSLIANDLTSSYIAACTKTVISSPGMASSSSNISEEPYKMQIVEMKSAAVYEKWWRRYNDYADGRSSSTNDVKTFMNWLCTMKQSKEFAPTTIISAGSCVNSKMKLNFDVNFMDHVLVKDIIKGLQKESAPKQASVFTMEQIEMFVLNAPETLDIRIKKIAALVAIQGALRISEVVNIGYDDVTFLNNASMSIRIKCSKTDQAGKGYSFIITPNVNAQLYAVLRMRTYMELIETKNGRLFRSATKAGKLGKQPIGVNSMAAIPRFIATFLELPNVDEFSGHSFRRTSATLLSEKGMGLLELKQHGRWKSTAVCERYVDNTVVKKMKTSNLLQNVDEGSASSNDEIVTFTNCSFVNCNINMVK